MGPESRLIERIRRHLRAPDVYLLKFHGNQFTRNGVPDLVGCVGPMAIWWEAKVPGNKPTPRQLAEHERIRRAGCRVAVVESVEDAAKELSMLRELSRGILASGDR